MNGIYQGHSCEFGANLGYTRPYLNASKQYNWTPEGVAAQAVDSACKGGTDHSFSCVHACFPKDVVAVALSLHLCLPTGPPLGCVVASCSGFGFEKCTCSPDCLPSPRPCRRCLKDFSLHVFLSTQGVMFLFLPPDGVQCGTHDGACVVLSVPPSGWFPCSLLPCGAVCVCLSSLGAPVLLLLR